METIKTKTKRPSLLAAYLLLVGTIVTAFAYVYQVDITTALLLHHVRQQNPSKTLTIEYDNDWVLVQVVLDHEKKTTNTQISP